MQASVRAKAEAIERLLAGVRQGTVDLISSEVVEDEVRRNPSMERRAEAETLLSLAVTRLEIDDGIAHRAEGLVDVGYGPIDVLHVAAAESGGVDALLTTDDRLLRRTSRKLGNPRIRVENPVSCIKEQGP